MNATTAIRDAAAPRRHSHAAGLRTVGLFEALKGVAALTLAYFVSRAIRHDYDFEDAAERLLDFFHISLSHNWVQHVLDAADKVSDFHPATILIIAAVYATIRFLEGYGLWKQRVWAEWLAIISGCIYLPLEISKLVHRPSRLHWIVLITNIMVVLYIAWVRWDEIRAAREVPQ